MRFFDVVVVLGAMLLASPLAGRLGNLPAAVVVMGLSGIAAASALRPEKARRTLGRLALVRFRLRTIFVAVAAVGAICALAPELRDFLVAFFVVYFALAVIGTTLLG
jgi:hypothetical protein